MLAKLHARLGDFWWYSLMIFCACRAADLLNAFVGLWLVPKYVGQSELGAVQPLTQFANFLAIPAAAFANTFRNEVSRLAIGREFGKLKTLMRGVFIATAIFLFVAIIAAKFMMPLFLERIRIAEGSLAFVIIAASFVSTVAPVYTNTLQALKKFKAQSLLSIVGAPIRLVVMLIAMPFRAITGYFVGQAATPAFGIAASVFALKNELSVKPEPYWNRETFKKFSVLLVIFLVWGVSSSFYGLIEATVIRQRLSDIDSAGYYIATRFSEIAGFLAATFAVTLFPYIAETAAEGKDTRPLTIKSLAVNGCFCLLLAMPFLFLGSDILSLLPNGDLYSAYWWAIPWHIGIVWLSSLFGFYSLSEMAASRFGFLKWAIPLDLLYPVTLLIVTGHGYFVDIVPASLTAFLDAHNIYSLKTMFCWMTGINAIKATFSIVAMIRPNRCTLL